MKNFYPVFWLLFSGVALQAQTDWQLFRPGVQYLYEYPDAAFPESPVLGVKTGAESCTEMYPALRWRGEFECSEVGSSFMGYEICQTPTETRLRVFEDEYVTIRQTAALNEKWPAYAQGGDTVWARVSFMQSMNFLGLTDSVKSIVFYTQEPGSSLVFIPADNRPILVSKQYGLISTFWFRDFPHYNSWTANSTNLLPLIGLSEPNVGLQNTTKDEVFNLQVGDELHILRTTAGIAYGQMGTTLGDGFWKEFFKVTITEVETTNPPESLKYHYTGQYLKTRLIGPPTSSYDVYPVEVIADEWEFDLEYFEFLDLQPGALFPFPSQFNGDIASVFLQSYDFCDGKPGKSLGPTLGGDEFCLNHFPDANGGQLFVEGLAGDYYNTQSVGGAYTRHVAYFRRDTSECGTPFDLIRSPIPTKHRTRPPSPSAPTPPQGRSAFTCRKA